MDNTEISLGVSMGIGTVQGFTTFVGNVSNADMMDPASYWRGVGLSVGWTFLIACAVAGWSNTYTPLIAWLIVSGAMLASYEYQRDRADA